MTTDDDSRLSRKYRMNHTWWDSLCQAGYKNSSLTAKGAEQMKPEDKGKPADKGRDFAPGRMEGGGKANAPGQNREDREKPDKPGQQKMKTVTNPTTGEQRILTKAEIKAQKAALIAAGFTGPGLDVDDDDDDVPVPPVPPAV